MECLFKILTNNLQSRYFLYDFVRTHTYKFLRRQHIMLFYIVKYLLFIIISYYNIDIPSKVILR